MGTIEDVKFRILAFLKENGEANASQLEEKAECANKTFLKARQQLEKDGYIAKEYKPKPNGGLYAVYSLTPKGVEYYERKSTERDITTEINEKIENASREDLKFLKQKILEMARELEFHKIKAKFFELLRKRLPERACRQKLKHIGLSVERLDGYVGLGLGYDEFTPDDVEIKIIPENTTNISPEDFVGYYPLTKEPQNGYYIIGAYKELLILFEKIMDFIKLRAIKEYGLTEDEWRKLDKRFRTSFSMPFFTPSHSFDWQTEVEDVLKLYVWSKKTNALELFKNYFRQRTNFKESYIEELAKNSLEYFRSLYTNKKSNTTQAHKAWIKMEVL